MSYGIAPDGAARRLRAKLDPLVAELSERSHEMADHARPRIMYPALLELMYSLVRTTVPLLTAVERRAAELSVQGDAVAAAILPWLGRHIEEESDHGAWLLADYARVGGNPQTMDARPGSPTMACLVGSVYYWALNAHPVAILGYCTVLEGSPPSRMFIEQMIRATGFPRAAFDTLHHRAIVDEDHGGEIFRLVDQLALTASHESLIGMTALQTADFLIAAGDEMLMSLDYGTRSTELHTSAHGAARPA
jgi:Iron-containing redox enzyme